MTLNSEGRNCKEQSAPADTKQKRYQDLSANISRLEAELVDLKQTNDHLRQEVDRLRRQYTAIRRSRTWQGLKLLLKFKKRLRLIVQIVLGRRHPRELFSRSWKMKRAEKRLKKVKYNLYEQGFTKKALAELTEIHSKTDQPYLKKLAAWELALWYANQYNADGARRCLNYLPDAIRGVQGAHVKEQEFLRRAAIIEAECHDLLGNIEEGKKVLTQALATQKHVDLYLARANLESAIEERLRWINKALDMSHIARLSVDQLDHHSPYDSLVTENQHQAPTNADHAQSVSNEKLSVENRPKVTVIIPAYHAENVIHTSLSAVLAQTWQNIEVLVVDDGSTDATSNIVERYAQNDTRVQLIKSTTNGGAYVARNLALKQAAGEFVTVNDADDWSHPQKLEKQVVHLLNHPSVMANTSMQARATEDLKFYRRGKPGSYLFPNMSSLLFRREPVLQALGFWDSVRFGADGEFKRRLKQVFGDEAVVDLATGPLSFQRQSQSSLTGNQVFGFHGYFMGARKEYFESYRYYHQRTSQQAEALWYDFPQKERPFAVPEPMWPQREHKPSGRRHFDVVIASEFRLSGGTNMSNVEEIKAQKRMGLRTGLVQMSRYDFHSSKEINPKVREQIDGDRVQMLVYGEQVSCNVLIVRHPPVLQEWQKYMPDIQAKHICVIVNQPPKKEYSSRGATLYDIRRCVMHLQTYFGQAGKWYPIGPQVRASLHEHHARELTSIKLAGEDWVNIIDVQEWKRPAFSAHPHRPEHKGKVRIGRHSRPQYVKWPSDPEELLAIYPDSEEYDIHVLGGADVPRNILGRLPANWHVYEFGEMDPKDFLAQLDVFVYYTHPDWVEAFGRVIFEAMAVGVPVIIPPSYKKLFGEAALYAEPTEVQEKIKWLMNDEQAYISQVEKAHAYVEQHFGYAKHASRLAPYFLPAYADVMNASDHA